MNVAFHLRLGKITLLEDRRSRDDWVGQTRYKFQQFCKALQSQFPSGFSGLSHLPNCQIFCEDPTSQSELPSVVTNNSGVFEVSFFAGPPTRMKMVL